MNKKRASILFVCIAIFTAIFIAIFWPCQWTAVEATDPEGWKLTVHKVPNHKIDYMINCIVDFTMRPDMDCYYQCELSELGHIVSSRTFWWPSYYSENIQIEFLSSSPDGKRTAVIKFDDTIKVHCSWSLNLTDWEAKLNQTVWEST